ncbi:MAG: response regulator [Bryobacterales bacterium]
MIDDNEHGLAARRNILEGEGYAVEVACCGQDGVDRFEGGSFDLVVTDFRMPDLNGPEVIDRIRQTAPGVPIVLLSGYASLLGLTESDTGADIVLAKGPTEQNELLRAIGSLMRRRPSSDNVAAQRHKAATA